MAHTTTKGGTMPLDAKVVARAKSDIASVTGDWEGFEADPYSYAVATIATVLEYALDDGISGAMSQSEFDTLDKVARYLVEQDPAITIEPRPA